MSPTPLMVITVALCVFGMWLFAILGERYIADGTGLHPLICMIGVVFLGLLGVSAVNHWRRVLSIKE